MRQNRARMLENYKLLKTLSVKLLHSSGAVHTVGKSSCHGPKGRKSSTTTKAVVTFKEFSRELQCRCAPLLTISCAEVSCRGEWWQEPP